MDQLMNDCSNLIVGDSYKLMNKIGSGGFGVVYQAINLKKKEDVVAVKLQDNVFGNSSLMHEVAVYEDLLKGAAYAVPQLYLHGSINNYDFMAIELLGPSLLDLLNYCGDFSLKTILLIADQALSRLEYLHCKNYVHRDIKPENLLIGLNRRAHVLYLVDFGLSKSYINSSDEHIPFTRNNGLTGTRQYMSLNAHEENELSRRDDLESLGYVLVHLYKKSLPWQKLLGNVENRFRETYEIKRKVTAEDLTTGMPAEFTTFIKYAKSLNFDEKPDYLYLKNLFRNLFRSKGFILDNCFDWVDKKIKEIK